MAKYLHGAYGFLNVPSTGGGSGGTTDHARLINRDAEDQHPISAITGLADALDGKGTYTKPSGGIPRTDLASAVQTSLGLADSALQEHLLYKCDYGLTPYADVVAAINNGKIPYVTFANHFFIYGKSQDNEVDFTVAVGIYAYKIRVTASGWAYDGSIYATTDDLTQLSDKITDVTIQLLAETKRLASFSQLKNLLPEAESNPVLQDALIGCEIPDTWAAEDGTSYSDPMIVVALENIEDENGGTHWGAYVQRKYEALRSVQFDAAETEYPNGYNNYVQSGIRQYLNSAAGIGEWWTATHEGDIAPLQLDTVRGYMAGCSAALLAAAKPCRVSCKPAGGDAETVTDTFWLPSARQMYGIGNDGEGVFWPYWKLATGLDSPSDGANSGRIVYQISSHTTTQTCRLRSAYYNNAKSTLIVSNAGAISTGDASNSYYFTPCCAIW